MNELRPGLPPLPPKMRGLHIDKRGFPVPFFVAMVDGEPDHRIVEPSAMQACIKHGRCWICGGLLGAFKSFVVGPMCAVNRISGEPPSHRECARYAAEACPFLSRPHAKRREAGLPEERKSPAGVHLKRNPGVSLVWTTRAYRLFKAPGGKLFKMGDADSMEWFAEGRAATRAEIDESIRTGVPSLVEIAQDAEELRAIDEAVSALALSLDRQFAGPTAGPLP